MIQSRLNRGPGNLQRLPGPFFEADHRHRLGETLHLMHRIAFLFLLLAGAVLPASGQEMRYRVFVSTDIGGSDPDDYQSMVHYLVSSDLFETEGVISSPPHQGRVEAILECIDAYEKDYPSLKGHSDAYPDPDQLRRVSLQGAIDPQAGDLPDARISEGARHLIHCAKRKDSRPLWVLVWGSITDVAQAVHADASIKDRIRIYSIGSWNTRQDEKARHYLFTHHPDLWWIENDTTFRGMYMGGEQKGDLGNLEFARQHVAGHGALGALFASKMMKIKMGDTPSVLYLMSGDPDRPDAPHWGGAFVRPHPKERPQYWHDNEEPALSTNGKAGAVTVNQWRKEYLEDWKLRMDRTLPASRAERLLRDMANPASGHVLVAAHRGGWERDWANKAPENSLANIDKAVAMGFDVYETDLRLTRDGHFVIMHDATIDRTTNGNGIVTELGLADLKPLRLRYKNGKMSDEVIPTFEDFLRRAGGRILFKIDYKADIESFPKAVKLVEKHGMMGQVIFRLPWKAPLAERLQQFIGDGMPNHPNLLMFKTRNARQVSEIAERFHPGVIEITLDKEITPEALAAMSVARKEGMLVETHSWGGPKECKALMDAGFRMFHTFAAEEMTDHLRKEGRLLP